MDQQITEYCVLSIQNRAIISNLLAIYWQFEFMKLLFMFLFMEHAVVRPFQTLNFVIDA